MIKLPIMAIVLHRVNIITDINYILSVVERCHTLFDLTKASVHDIHYLKDVKCNFQNCTIIGDRGYIGAAIQLDLFEKANIKLEVPYRSNQKIGNLYLVHLLKQGKGLKRFLHNYAINL